jgi:hypothetical protein
MVGEIYAITGRNPSKWVESVLRERLEAEKRKRMLGLLPEPLREKLIKTAGSEDAATHLLVKAIEAGLTELEAAEDEDLIQQVLGEAHERERLSEVKQGQSSLSGRG